jgi:LTXXQ motif family protein
MQSNNAGALAVILLFSASLITIAAAQQRRGPGGGAPGASAPHISAPAPHFSAPAQRFSAPAPHISAPAPHVSAPAPHLSAPAQPRFSAPLPRFAAPAPGPQRAAPNAGPPQLTQRGALPQFTPRAANPGLAAPPVAPSGRAISGIPGGTPQSQTPGAASRTPGAADRLNLPLARSHVPPAPQTGAGNLARGRQEAPNTSIPAAIGQGAEGRNRYMGGLSQNVVESRTGGPALRNPAFANLSARDPANRALAQSTFGGRFAQSGFARGGGDRDRRFHFGRVIGFLGPVFWPYAYNDLLDYTFSPYAYDTFWPYAYDDVFDGIYGAYAHDYSNYVSGGTAYGYANAPLSPGSSVGAFAGGTTQICSGQTEGLTDFPIRRIAEQVQPDQNQQALLDDLRADSIKSLDILRSACPSDLPSTPPGRLAAMRARVEAMLQAVQVVRPSLENFYQSLSDEQKERFNSLDAENAAIAQHQQPDPAQLCNGRTQATNLPIAEINRVLQLSGAQEADLSALDAASVQAGDILRANCATEPTLTPTARLADMERRFEAMMQALDVLQPALGAFYGSLDDEQKAQFNRFSARPA